jgi:hypothetical protein
MNKFYLFIVIFLVIANNSFALDYKTYREGMESIENRNMTIVYIAGVGNGIFWSNILLENVGNHKFYCQPEDLTLNGDHYVSILDNFIIDKKMKDDTPVDMVLFYALVDKFPCK